MESLNLFLSTKKTLKSKIEDLKDLIEKGVKVIISASSLKRAEWIADILEEFSLPLICSDLKSLICSDLNILLGDRFVDYVFFSILVF